MKNEKSKGAGKFNIIDVLVIAVIVIAVIFVGLKLSGDSSDLPDGVNRTRLLYTVRVDNVQPEVYESVKALIDADDAHLMANGKAVEGKIVDVTAEPHKNEAFVSSSGVALVIPMLEENLDLRFTIDTVVDDPFLNRVGTQEVRIGKTHIVKTDKIELANGIIVDCQWGDEAA